MKVSRQAVNATDKSTHILISIKREEGQLAANRVHKVLLTS